MEPHQISGLGLQAHRASSQGSASARGHAALRVRPVLAPPLGESCGARTEGPLRPNRILSGKYGSKKLSGYELFVF